MTEITHRQLEALICRSTPAELPSIWLVHGEQLLVERSALSISEHLLAGCPRELCSSGLEGTFENIPDLLEQLNTFALLGSNKVVFFKNARLFEPRGGAADLIQQIELTWRNEQPVKAGRLMLEWSARSGQNLKDILDDTGSDNSEIKSLEEALGVDILKQVIQHALTLPGPGGGDHIDTLMQAIEKGFPTGHVLIITVHSKAPKNYKLYKSIEKHGAVIDCSVPTGERRADKSARETVLRESWQELLHKAAKKADAGVFEAVVQLIGFNLATFCQSTEKLIDYSGNRTQITMNDVQCVLRRTRTDPIYDLTNAVSDRNLPQALFYLYSLQSDWHPLQIVAALANQLRRLLLARSFIDSEFGKTFYAGISYPQFQEQVMPAVLAYDAHVQKLSAAWQANDTEPRRDISPDLRLATQPKNAYPVFQSLNKAHKFTRTELVDAAEHLSRADVLLKSAGQNAGLILSQVIQSVCRTGQL